MTTYQDKTKICIERDCAKEFILTAGEQEFAASKGFPETKRCKDCRIKRKAEKEKEVTKQAIRASSPFLPIFNEMQNNKNRLNNHGGDFERRGRKPKSKNHRRHGREQIADWEGGR